MFEHFNRDDRMIMMFATQEAAELGHRALGDDHLILGMLCNARTPIFSVLAGQGLTLDGARTAVREFHEGHAEAQEQAQESSAEQRYEEDREVLKSIGIDLDKVRAAVGERFGDDLSQGWGERISRGRRGGRCGPGHGERGRGQGRRGGPAAFGPGAFGPGFSGPDFGPGFAPDSFGPEDSQFGGAQEGPWDGGRGRRGPRGRGGRPRFGAATRDVFRVAVEKARERGDRQLRPEYLMLAIIEAADPASIALIESATTVDALRSAVLAGLPEAPAGV